MSMKKVAMFALVTSLAICSTLRAQETEKKFAVSGPAVGAESCIRWLEHYPKKDKDFLSTAWIYRYTAWVEGYLSGVNSQRVLKGDRPLTIPPHAVIEAHVNLECTKKPKRELMYAALSLFYEQLARGDYAD